MSVWLIPPGLSNSCETTNSSGQILSLAVPQEKSVQTGVQREMEVIPHVLCRKVNHSPGKLMNGKKLEMLRRESEIFLGPEVLASGYQALSP